MTIKKIYKNSAIGIVIFTLISMVWRDWHMPAGVIAGGLLGLFNLRGMVRSLSELQTSPTPNKTRIMVRSFVRLTLLFAAIILLAAFKAVNLVGLFVGFSVVLFCTVAEGFFSARQQ